MGDVFFRASRKTKNIRGAGGEAPCWGQGAKPLVGLGEAQKR